MFDFRAWLRKTFTPLVGAGACAAIMCGQASAGNIVLTGHDDDFHDKYDDLSRANPANQPGQQLKAMANFAIAGNLTVAQKALPILVLDQPSGGGQEMNLGLTALGFATVAVDPSNLAALTAKVDPGATGKGAFLRANYSAIAIASGSSCGGCDNTVAGYNNIDSFASSIADFFNLSGGILQTTGGFTSAQRNVAYKYLPTTSGTPSGSPPSTGYNQTAAGAIAGIPAVNGDATHNFFAEPGSKGGPAAAYQVFERNGNVNPAAGPLGTVETIGLAGGRITGTTIVAGVPEPATMGLAAMGLASLAGYGMRKRKKKDA